MGRAIRTRVGAHSFDRMPSLTVEIHRVSSRRGSRCPHPNRHPGSIAGRCSPPEFTGFRVSAGGDIHTRAGAPERREGGQGCGYRAAGSTHNPVHPQGECERRIGEAAIRRCGYLPPTLTLRAVDFNGECRNPLKRRTGCGVDIPRPMPLETLCNRTVSASARPAGSPRHCGHPPPATNPNAVYSMGEHAPFPRPNPCRTGRERLPPRPRFAFRSSPPVRRGAPAHPDTRRQLPTTPRENSLNSRPKPAQFCSLRCGLSKMRKNFLVSPRKNRAIQPPRPASPDAPVCGPEQHNQETSP